MDTDRYKPGDAVPGELFGADGDAELVFRTAVEVVSGFDNVRHVYPEETVEDVRDVVRPADGADAEVQTADGARFYRVPRNW